jgi:hypothetical protein
VFLKTLSLAKRMARTLKKMPGVQQYNYFSY